MRLGEFMWAKRYQVLFTTQGFTLVGIYAHRFGYLDEYLKFLEDDEDKPVPTLPVQRQQEGREAIWKKAMELPVAGSKSAAAAKNEV
ncbi:hypothetical protein H310_02137 [Aphanomyces invadans]|uniref:Uncharacterized protein n=1 Tax=Aphanomyces invadans TaxID=157072 RepID=A0A024UMZ3_9STRA|nr:hypothetical protein H310_02137 [Aphanomyces invadans]ETW07679.1 hypothetical protein H310_02137 [Aphanomyces invadans]RHY30358.1 hypothetical protein DYB32_004384 [Aphanomyces invadans]|eukprot:XP_008863772.1 hypothetical protein H310_02137 [Aphanomyces invadans]